jgi:hypothetical protein
MLDNDITRCRGEGNAWTVCARRLQCQRYLTIAEDVAGTSGVLPRPFRSYSAMLCRPPNYPFLWPVCEK